MATEQRRRRVVAAAIVTLAFVMSILQFSSSVLWIRHKDIAGMERLMTQVALQSSPSGDHPNPPKKNGTAAQEGQQPPRTNVTTTMHDKPVIPVSEALTESEKHLSQPQLSLDAARRQAAACDAPAARQRKGIIVVSLLGRMGNNLFQVAVANRLAEQLCWSVVYRPSWQGPLAHDARTRTCFPGAFAHASGATDYHRVPVSVRDALNITAEQWDFFQKTRSNAQFDVMRIRVRDSQPDGWWYEIDDTTTRGMHQGLFLDNLVASIQNDTLPTRVIHLRGFFINYQYVQGWLPRIKDWSSVDTTCCQTKPTPSSTIVLHWRDFNDADGKQYMNSNTDWVQVYMDILRQRGWWKRRPLWILTQPSSVNTPDVQRLANLSNAVIHTGVDVPDAMCILQQASTILMSYSSTFSQGPVLLGDSTGKEVHYPLLTLRRPAVTVPVPTWQYHLANDTGIARFNVPFEQIRLG